MKRYFTIIVTAILFFGMHAFAGHADSILGEWYTEEDRSIVEIARCGDHYCGKIIWLKYPKNEAGNNKVDVKNPDETLRNQPLVGLEILKNFRYKDANEWDGGKIYDPKNGKTYSCKMTLEGNVLKVRGFVGVSLFGRTTTWTKKS